LAAFIGYVGPCRCWCIGARLGDTDCKALVAPSPFGPDDQTGATNRVTPAVTKARPPRSRPGIVTPMAFNLTDSVPLFGTLQQEPSDQLCDDAGADSATTS